jgi:hypothetical protein
MGIRIALGALSLAAFLSGPMAHAEMTAEELAKISQNPLGNLISLPFQNDLNLNDGPLEKNKNVL